ncbi:PAS domain S-box-containing protein/diguanylate cyclase (GGDEF)-like protein [Halospina denitrificans]|uniref:cyclic-guanylate-specific phosphodiesterase n=1 Tax=Halospina denitrificans TaxID=332522 RepID=A0A4R7JW06_9GAMM|nr:EAL domain-containing protein [Halospina denitrificans]TDT41623.1 PAS domain S-box-containing protein/diguanylate cyclase (GGDEF)-like protein [Halospina denitrificans]
MRNPLSWPARLRKQSPLSFRLLGYIILCSSVFTLVASAAQVYVDYQADVSAIRERLSDIEDGYKSSLAGSVWAIDEDLIRLQLEGITSLPDISRARLRMYPDAELTVGDVPADAGTASHSFTLSRSAEQDYQLGRVTVTASLESANENLQRNIQVIFTTQALRTFFISLLILWIFQYFVARHLGTMARYTRQFTLRNLDTPLRLDRNRRGKSVSDELDQVTDAINSMRERLRSDLERQQQDAREIRKLSLALEQSPSSVIICDRDWRIEYVNNKFLQLTGLSRDDVLGQYPAYLTQDTLSGDQNQELWKNVRLQAQRAGVWQGEMQRTRENGERFWEQVVVTPIKDERDIPSHYLILGEDISIRKRYEQQLLRQANYDTLTGLPNRMLALDRLKLALAQSRRDGSMVGVMFLDLDNFKHINDTLGHEAGDNLLIEGARRISACLRGTSTVARLGGDEFLVILPSLSSPAAVEQVAERILQTFVPPFHLADQEVFVSTSIGIALYPGDSDDSTNLLQNADAAMYEAKHRGKSAYQRFQPEMKEVSQERLQMESLLRRALEMQEFELHFQPIIRMDDRQLVGAEALLRWESPTLGEVSPDRFIPLAEETGLIISIGRWVLQQACQAVSRWNQEREEPLCMAINVSPRQFRDPHFVETIRAALDESGLGGESLELEITERLILDNNIDTDRVLAELDAMNVRLSVDDFGTGYSALGYIKKYPFDTLKIDKSFIHDMTTKADDSALVRAIIQMAHSLSLQVIAEGVEAPEEFEFLKKENCDYAQGFLFTPPLREDSFITWLNGTMDR